MAYKGFFKLKNPNKYKGDPTNVVYRSRWELLTMQKLDNHPDIIEWSSEEIIIPYRSPVDGKVHRYFPDFWIKKKDINGNISCEIIEVKPYKQTQPPVVIEAKNKPSRRYINEVMTWGINSAKWKAANEYCRDKGWKFTIITENELGIKF